jgi:hypothetical protein
MRPAPHEAQLRLHAVVLAADQFSRLSRLLEPGVQHGIEKRAEHDDGSVRTGLSQQAWSIVDDTELSALILSVKLRYSGDKAGCG